MKLRDFRGGLLIPSKNESIPLKSIEVSCDVLNLTAKVSTKFVYENDTDKALEAKFVFPLNDVTVYHFEATIDDRKIVAECRPREEAKSTYEDAVEAGHSAFLAEQDEHCDDVFQMSVGNIPAHGKVSILLKYVGLLKAELVRKSDSDLQSQLTFTLPTVLNPRYRPENSSIPTESDPFVQPPALNKLLYTMSFEAELDMPCPIVDVTSPHDQYVLERKSNSQSCASVKMSSKFTPDHDLQMVIKLADRLQSMTFLEPGSQSDKTGLMAMSCLMTQFIPDFTELATMIESRTEVVFLIDRSGSMGGSRMKFVQTSLLLFLKSLPPGCRLQIIGFGSNHASLFTEPTDYTEETMNQALEYQQNLKADMGGTEVYPALRAAFDTPLTGQGWHRQIIFLTDGDVWNADEIIGLTSLNADKARVFTIGLGEGASTTLVEGIARAGRGLSAGIYDNSQLNSTVMRILNAALQPRASDLHIEWNLFETEPGGNKKPLNVINVPEQLPPIFYGHFTTAFAFFKCDNPSNVSGSVSLTFDLKGKRELTAQIAGPGKTSLDASDLPIHRLASKVQLQQWTNQYNLFHLKKQTPPGEPEEPIKPEDEIEPDEIKAVKKQIEDLSCQTNIISKFTSLIGVDPAAPKDDKPVKLPHRVPQQHGLGAAPRGIMMCSAVMPASDCANLKIKGALFHRPCAQPMATPPAGFAFAAPSAHPLPPPPACFESAAPKPHEAKGLDTSMPVHIQLATLQQFCGSWKLDQDLARIINVPLENIKQSKPKTLPSDPNQLMKADEIWTTALVLAYLESHQSANQIEWSLLAQRAKNWLLSQAPTSKPAEQFYSELIKTAKSVVEKK